MKGAREDSKHPPERTLPLTIGDRTTQIQIREPSNPVPASDTHTIIIANGAGAAMHHPFIEYFYQSLAAAGFRTVRFNFLYQTVSGRRPPDRGPILEETYLRVVEGVANLPDVSVDRIVAGGKSMGGRIASLIAGRAGIDRLVFWGYPLHPPGKPEKVRDEHLYMLNAKMLFLQGTRDPFATPDVRNRVYGKLERSGKAKLILVPEGDHSLQVPKRMGIDQEDVMAKVVDVVKSFV